MPDSNNCTAISSRLPPWSEHNIALWDYGELKGLLCSVLALPGKAVKLSVLCPFGRAMHAE